MNTRKRRGVFLLGAVILLSIVATVVVEGTPTAIRGPLAAGRATMARLGAPHVVVEGNQLVDARGGEVFVPRGVNVPGLEYACAQGWAMGEYDSWGAARELGDRLRDWSVNTVRLPLNLDCWMGSRGAPAAGGLLTRNRFAYRATVRTMVDTLRARGILTVLALHSRKHLDENQFGTRGGLSEDGVAFWRSLAGEYQDVAGVIFDVINEPHSRWDEMSGTWAFVLDWPCWQLGGCQAPVETDDVAQLSGETYTVQGVAQAVEVIREAGAEQPIVLSGLDWANDLSGWLQHRPADDQLVAAAHLYEFKRCATPQCFDAELAPVAASVPLLITEFGEADGDTAFATSVMDWADSHGVGYLAWAWMKDTSNQWAFVDEDGNPLNAVGQLIRDRYAAYG